MWPAGRQYYQTRHIGLEKCVLDRHAVTGKQIGKIRAAFVHAQHSADALLCHITVNQQNGSIALLCKGQ